MQVTLRLTGGLAHTSGFSHRELDVEPGTTIADVLEANACLWDAFNTDVRPLCAKVRESIGAAPDPVAALRSGGYVNHQIAQRGSTTEVVGGYAS